MSKSLRNVNIIQKHEAMNAKIGDSPRLLMFSKEYVKIVKYKTKTEATY